MKRRRISPLLALLAAAALAAQEPAAPALPPGGYQVVVLDAAHGGADTGARGAAGLLEKDVTLMLAREVRRALEAQGWRVVETRTGDELVPLDRRAAAANAERGAVFLTLHVGSIGAVGTAARFSFPRSTRRPSPLPAAPSPPLRGCSAGKRRRSHTSPRAAAWPSSSSASWRSGCAAPRRRQRPPPSASSARLPRRP